MTYGYGNQQRRALRRAFKTRCETVSWAGFELIGDTSLDVSPRGVLLACDAPVALGERVIVSLRAPGREAYWFDAEAEVARIVQGYRHNDPGYCAGLRFTYLERRDRHELLTRLAGLPPPVPRRRLVLHPPVANVQVSATLRVGTPYPVPNGAFAA